MAELRLEPNGIQWGRVGGRFVIQSVVHGRLSDKQAVTVVERTWVLTPEEEAGLRAALSGVIVSSEVLH